MILFPGDRSSINAHAPENSRILSSLQGGRKKSLGEKISAESQEFVSELPRSTRSSQASKDTMIYHNIQCTTSVTDHRASSQELINDLTKCVNTLTIGGILVNIVSCDDVLWSNLSEAGANVCPGVSVVSLILDGSWWEGLLLVSCRIGLRGVIANSRGTAGWKRGVNRLLNASENDDCDEKETHGRRRRGLLPVAYLHWGKWGISPPPPRAMISYYIPDLASQFLVQITEKTLKIKIRPPPKKSWLRAWLLRPLFMWPRVCSVDWRI